MTHGPYEDAGYTNIISLGCIFKICRVFMKKTYMLIRFKVRVMEYVGAMLVFQLVIFDISHCFDFVKKKKSKQK